MQVGPSRETILASNSLVGHLSSLGVRLRGQGPERTATRCAGKQHKPDHWCVTVNVAKEIWHCNDCGLGGTIVDWLAVEQGKSASQIFKEMAAKCQDAPPDEEPSNPKVVATYDYTDGNGELLYQVVRLEPKSFRQRQPEANGGWRWTMDGATRVPYRLPEVLTAETVYIVEGEKDAESLRKLGLVATCNVGGAGKWLDAYSEFLRGRHAIVIPDNDTPGKNHAAKVLESLSGKVLSAKLVSVPDPNKDASDYIATFQDNETAKASLLTLVSRAPHALKPLPWLDIRELEAKYTAMVRSMESVSFDLGKFLPGLGAKVRKLIPGQLVVVLASTGVGKTAILQSMAKAANPLPTLFFELELPAEDMFERFVQMEIGCYASDIEEEYKTLSKPIYKHYKGLSHILVCPDSGLTVTEIESLIDRSELKLGRRPVVVFVDYIGLIAPGKSATKRYEAISDAAEQLKVIAKRTNTIIIMSSQVHRPNEKKKGVEVSLNDGKDSGSIENSAGLVLGAWRPDRDKLVLKILKNTKGRTGAEIMCNFDGGKMRIEEIPQTFEP